MLAPPSTAHTTTAPAKQKKPVTTFTRVPHWLLETEISANQLRLYTAMGKFTDNETGWCYPGKKALAEILGCSERIITEWMNKLVEVGAVQRIHRGHKTNLYRLVFDDPRPQTDTHPQNGDEQPFMGGMNGRSPELDSPELDPGSLHPHRKEDEASLYPQQVEAKFSHDSFSDDSVAQPPATHKPKNRHGLKEETYLAARDMVQAIGEAYRDSQDYETAWELQSQLTEFVEENMRDQSYWIELANIVANESSFTEKHADPYEAGKKLLTLISTAKIPRDQRLDGYHYPPRVQSPEYVAETPPF